MIPSPASSALRVAALILAGGASSRMGRENKLLAELEGQTMVERVAAVALASRADPVLVVLGHGYMDVRPRLPDDVGVVENPAHASGLASSLVAGVRALPEEVDGCVVMLGDMPFVRPDDVDALIAAFDADAACVPLVGGRRGNPVLWPRTFFDDILELKGDHGARRIFESRDAPVVDVPLENPGLLFDVDTREDLERARSATRSIEIEAGRAADGDAAPGAPE
ncbi:MAG: nucleotidyltransferase family protein [Longimicrobiales bacterium]|nr:nucleotidyltransferase family protein [Longimicrobiales bacterium]